MVDKQNVLAEITKLYLVAKDLDETTKIHQAFTDRIEYLLNVIY